MLQYIIIAILFIVAVGFMVRKFMPSKNKGQGCSKCSGCSTMEHSKSL